MGIHSFGHVLRLIRNKYSDIRRPVPPPDVTSVLIDANGLIYGAFRKVVERHPDVISMSLHDIEELIIEQTIREIDQLRIDHAPSTIFAVIFDGVPPDAKASQQKDRRFVAAVERDEIQSKRMNGGVTLTIDELMKATKFDTSAISPGTRFMARLMEKVKQRLSEYDTIVADKKNPTATYQIFSSDMVPGEGEHKIMAMIRMGLIKPTGNHIIVGDDNDIIILASLLELKNIYICRNHKDRREWVNIELFKFYLSDSWDITPEDFLIVITLRGNDFIPTPIALMPSVNMEYSSIDILIDCYKEMRSMISGVDRLISNGELVIDNLKIFLELIAKREKEMIQNVALTRNSEIFERNMEQISINVNPGPYLQDKIERHTSCKFPTSDHFNDFCRDTVVMEYLYNIMYSKNGPLTPAGVRRTIANGSQSASDDQIDEIYTRSAIEFIAGLVWTYAYYTDKGVNNAWVYHYVFAPTFSCMADVITHVRSDLVTEIKHVMNSSVPLMTIQELLYSIIPPNANIELPPKVMDYMKTHKDLFVPTIERFGMPAETTHLYFINLPPVERIQVDESVAPVAVRRPRGAAAPQTPAQSPQSSQFKRGRWILKGFTPKEWDEVLINMPSTHGNHAKTILAERNETQINIATQEKSRHDLESRLYTSTPTQTGSGRSSPSGYVPVPPTSSTPELLRKSSSSLSDSKPVASPSSIRMVSGRPTSTTRLTSRK